MRLNAYRPYVSLNYRISNQILVAGGSFGYALLSAALIMISKTAWRCVDVSVCVLTTLLLYFSDIALSSPAPGRQPYEQGVSYHYHYDFNVTLNDNTNQSTAVGRAVGYKVTADLILTNIWQNANNPNEILLKLEVIKPKLHVSKVPTTKNQIGMHSSKLDHMKNEPVYIHWSNGIIRAIYSSSESTYMINIKKGIASILQFQMKPENSTELDISGYCTAEYHYEKNQITKLKKGCFHPKSEKYFHHQKQLQSLSLSHYNEIMYSLVKNYQVIQSAQGNEELKVYLNVWRNVSVLIHSEVRLKLENEKPTAVSVIGASVEKVIYTLSKKMNTQLIKDSLLATSGHTVCMLGNCKPLKTILREYHDQLATDHLASLKSAVAFLKLLEQLRVTSKQEITDILNKSKNKGILPQLIDALAASQTETAVQAALEFLDFSIDEIDLQERFLLGLSTASHPSHWLLNDILHLAKVTKFSSEKLKMSVLMTLGAITRTYSNLDNHKTKLVQEIENYFIKGLQDCGKNENCALIYLHALRNAALPSTIPFLLKYSLKGGKTTEVAMFAVKEAASGHSLNNEMKLLLERIYHQLWKYQDSTARIIAAELLIRNQPEKHDLENLIISLKNQDNPELSTFLLFKLEEVIEKEPDLRNLLNEILKNISVNNYYNIAQKGSSTAFKRLLSVGDTANVTLGVNMEMIPGGMLKRSTFDITMTSKEEELQLLAIALFTGGLGTISEENGQSTQQETTAGMQLNILGANLRPYTFFTGKTELMSHLWSGTGSEQTPIVQGNVLFMDYTEAFNLQSGLVAGINLRGVLSLDLTGSVQVSFWNKNANSLLQANASVLVMQSVQVDTSYAETQVDYMMGGETILDIITNLDFYEKPSKLCIQVQQPAFTFRQNIRKSENVPGSQHLIRTIRKKTLHTPGKSFALHRKNFVSCATMLNS